MTRTHTAATRALVAALALLLASNCSRKSDPTAESSGGAVNVTTSVARTGTLTDRLTSSGTVVVSRAAEFTVFAPEPADVAEIPKQEGDAVQTGDVLVRFDIPALTLAIASAELAVSQAAARLETAKSELAKISALSDKGMVPRATLDAARTEVVDAQSAVSHATGELNSVKGRQERTEVRAKFAGVVARRWHTTGDAVIPADTDPIIRVVDETRLQVLAPMAKADLTRLAPGLPATVAAPGSPGEPATIASMPAILEAGVATADIRLSFVGPTTLKRDAVVDVEIVLDEHPNVLIVPRKAVQREDDVAYVMIAGDDNIAHRKVVQVGFTTRDQLQISSGLSAGERVIVTGLDQLTDGAAIVIER